MALVSKQEIVKLARMSRIALHEEEIEPFMHQLNEILSYAARVAEIARDGTAEKEPQNVNVFRDDTAKPCPVIEHILTQAPEKEEHYFVVPAILDHE